MKITQYDIEDLGWQYKKREHHGDYLSIYYFFREESGEDGDGEYFLQHQLQWFIFEGDKRHLLIIKEEAPSHYNTFISIDIANLEQLKVASKLLD